MPQSVFSNCAFPSECHCVRDDTSACSWTEVIATLARLTQAPILLSASEELLALRGRQRQSAATWLDS
jgi:hypothetical protein